MRTVVLLGALLIANAIGKGELYMKESGGAVAFIAFVLLVAMAMDILDFIRGKK